MKPTTRHRTIITIIGVLAILAVGCATAAPAPAPGGQTGLFSASWDGRSAPPRPLPRSHGRVKADLGGNPFGFQTTTLYNCTNGTGNQVAFDRAKLFVNVLVRTGVIWVRPRSLADGHGSNPTTPIPSSNAWASGWVRLGDNQQASWGLEATWQGPPSVNRDEPPTTETSGAFDSVASLDVWCETSGDLVVVAH